MLWVLVNRIYERSVGDGYPVVEHRPGCTGVLHLTTLPRLHRGSSPYNSPPVTL